VGSAQVEAITHNHTPEPGSPTADKSKGSDSRHGFSMKEGAPGAQHRHVVLALTAPHCQSLKQRPSPWALESKARAEAQHTQGSAGRPGATTLVGGRQQAPHHNLAIYVSEKGS
jgi:hypothetical protein